MAINSHAFVNLTETQLSKKMWKKAPGFLT